MAAIANPCHKLNASLVAKVTYWHQVTWQRVSDSPMSLIVNEARWCLLIQRNDFHINCFSTDDYFLWMLSRLYRITPNPPPPPPPCLVSLNTLIILSFWDRMQPGSLLRGVLLHGRVMSRLGIHSITFNVVVTFVMCAHIQRNKLWADFSGKPICISAKQTCKWKQQKPRMKPSRILMRLHGRHVHSTFYTRKPYNTALKIGHQQMHEMQNISNAISISSKYSRKACNLVCILSAPITDGFLLQRSCDGKLWWFLLLTNVFSNFRRHCAYVMAHYCHLLSQQSSAYWNSPDS